MVIMNEDLKNRDKEYVENWLRRGKPSLRCAFVFTKSNELFSQLISTVTKRYSINKFFVPSHVGNVFEFEGKLYLLDIKPPRASVRLLEEYILNTADEFRIVLPDFELDVVKYQLKIMSMLDVDKFFNGEKDCGKYQYGYLSAIQSGVKCLKWLPNRKIHCSEFATMLCQDNDQLTELVADNVTPVELYDRLI